MGAALSLTGAATRMSLPAPPAVPTPRATGHGCGSARVGTETFAFDCHRHGYGFIADAATVIVKRDSFSLGDAQIGAAPLPRSVDHREQGTEGPVRNQGAVGACTAFSLAAVLDHELLANEAPGGTAVSAAQLWSRYASPYFGRAIGGNKGKFFTSEQLWPYDVRAACSWEACGGDDECTERLRVGCGQPVDQRAAARAESAPIAKLLTVTRLNHRSVRSLLEPIAKGKDIWFAVRVTDASMEPRSVGGRQVLPDIDAHGGDGGHAMALAGYRRDGDELYFLIHNSWGREWGDGGYAWIKASTLQLNITDAYVLTVGPAGAAPAPNPGSDCPPDTSADSITGQCAPRCLDGSPRSAGNCPVASHCPPGFANLIGRCVPAALPGSGVDPATGVRWICGPGGCGYTVPPGRSGCPSRVPPGRGEPRPCSVSCPSPRYLLALGPSGFQCTE